MGFGKADEPYGAGRRTLASYFIGTFQSESNLASFLINIVGTSHLLGRIDV